MKVCGIEIKGNNAIFACLKGDSGTYALIAEDVKKISIKESKEQADIRSFSTEICSFFNEMNFDRIAIKARAEKGKFSGGATSFKIEGLIQNTDHGVEIIHISTIKSKLKGLELDFSSVNKYQEEALKVAIMLLQ